MPRESRVESDEDRANARPRSVAIYCRASTTKEEQRHGLASQLRACKEFLVRQRVEFESVQIYQEQASGRKSDRPVLRKLLHDVALHKVQIVVVFRLDRLSRGGIGEMFRLVKYIEDHGGHLYSASEEWFNPDNPTHELTLAILSWASAFESQAIGERVASGIARRRAEAERRGEPFLWGRALVSPLRRDPELPVKAVRLRKDGLSWTKTARALGVGRTTARRLYQIGLASRANGTPAEEWTAEDGSRAS